MSLMAWDDTLSVGIDSLDDQHKKLIGLVNKLHDAMRAGSGQKVLATVLGELAAYTREHFSFEEQMMRRAGFQGFTTHATEHDRLTADVRRLQKDLGTGSLLTMDVMAFLQAWLTTHIMQSDKQYSACLQRARVS